MKECVVQAKCNYSPVCPKWWSLKTIRDGSLWKVSLTYELDLIIAGNENTDVTDEKLMKVWFFVFHSLYTFLYEIRVGGGDQGEDQYSHNHQYCWPENSKAIL